MAMAMPMEAGDNNKAIHRGPARTVAITE